MSSYVSVKLEKRLEKVYQMDKREIKTKINDYYKLKQLVLDNIDVKNNMMLITDLSTLVQRVL